MQRTDSIVPGVYVAIHVSQEFCKPYWMPVVGTVVAVDASAVTVLPYPDSASRPLAVVPWELILNIWMFPPDYGRLKALKRLDQYSRAAERMRPPSPGS